MIQRHTSGSSAVPIRPGATPLACPHPSCAMHRSHSLSDVVRSQRLRTHRTLVLCASAWGVRPFSSPADPQASLAERQNARLARHHSIMPMRALHGQQALQRR